MANPPNPAPPTPPKAKPLPAKEPPSRHDGQQQNPTASEGERLKGQEEDFNEQRVDPRDQPERYATKPAATPPRKGKEKT